MDQVLTNKTLQNGTEVCAVITTYRPNEEFPNRVQRIYPQVGCVIIVDDGDSLENRKRLQRWFSKIDDIILHHNEMNIGIAGALNNGLAIAKREGYRWVLMLDDDTVVEPDMVENLIKAWNFVTNLSGKPVAIMGMARSDEYASRKVSHSSEEVLFIEKRGIITSGSLMSLDVYGVVGPFRTEFFIDSVDYDYCLRVRSRGWRVIKVSKVGMVHPVGNSIECRIGNLTLKSTNHAPTRRYYAYRNSTVLAKEYFWRDPLYSLVVIFFQMKTLVLVLLLEKNRYRKLKGMFYGLLDGWRNRLGKRVLNE